jgi:hypothetical protein
MEQNYVPHDTVQFNAFILKLIEYVGRNMTMWGHIPQEPFSNLLALFGQFYDTFYASRRLHNTAQVEACREAQAKAARALNVFIDQYLQSPPVTNVDRIKMDIPTAKE